MSSQPLNLPQRLFDTAIADKNGLVTNPVWVYQFQAFAKAGIQLVVGSHALRLTTPSANYIDGTLYFETDRQVFYLSRGKMWNYFSGTFPVEQDGLPTDLQVNDAGFLAQVTDFAHLLRWTGANWEWGNNERNDFYLPFVTGPDPEIGWAACDGSNQIKLNSDGSTEEVTVPNVPGSWYRL
jgi:hypothetical protein